MREFKIKSFSDTINGFNKNQRDASQKPWNSSKLHEQYSKSKRNKLNIGDY